MPPFLGGLVLLHSERKVSMPIKVPDGLPAIDILREENISLIPDSLAFRQDIRPLRIGIVNNMPLKPDTERDLLRLLGNSPIQVEVTFLHSASHLSRNTDPSHIARFYKDFKEVQDSLFDGFVFTGADVETLPYSEVSYWEEFKTKLEWTRSHVYSTLHICWGAQAGLFYHYGIEKHKLPQKLFGVFPHTISKPSSPLLQGFDDVFFAPHSRHTDILREDIQHSSSLEILSESEVAGVYLVARKDGRQIFVTGHPEYSRHTLEAEYTRDMARGRPITLPANYFPQDDALRHPIMSWRGHAHLLITNWLTTLYKTTPFNLKDLVPIV